MKQSVEDCCSEDAPELFEQPDDNMLDHESQGIRMSHKQVYLAWLVTEGLVN